MHLFATQGTAGIHTVVFFQSFHPNDDTIIKDTRGQAPLLILPSVVPHSEDFVFGCLSKRFKNGDALLFILFL